MNMDWFTNSKWATKDIEELETKVVQRIDVLRKTTIETKIADELESKVESLMKMERQLQEHCEKSREDKKKSGRGYKFKNGKRLEMLRVLYKYMSLNFGNFVRMSTYSYNIHELVSVLSILLKLQ